MKNVMQFHSTRTKEERHMQNNQKSTALVVVEDLTEREALIMHTSVKERGRGAVKAFVENETPYESYPKYHYQLKKKGIMPMSKRKKSSLPTKTLGDTRQLQMQIDELKHQCKSLNRHPLNVQLTFCTVVIKRLATSHGLFCAVLSRKIVLR